MPPPTAKVLFSVDSRMPRASSTTRGHGYGRFVFRVRTVDQRMPSTWGGAPCRLSGWRCDQMDLSLCCNFTLELFSPSWDPTAAAIFVTCTHGARQHANALPSKVPGCDESRHYFLVVADLILSSHYPAQLGRAHTVLGQFSVRSC
jgi:hypothetical protein